MTTIADRGSALVASTPTRFRHALPALFFILLVLALNYPLVLNLGTHVASNPYDDTFEVIWQLATVERAVFESGANPFFTPHVFFPHGWYLASGAQPTWYYVLLSPLTAAIGAVAAYNVITLGTLIAGGFGAYWLARRLTGKTAAALIAGCAYMVAPFFTMRLGGHTHVLFGMMFLPYAVGATLSAMTEARAGRWVALGGVFLAATIISHWYFLFIATLPLLGAALTVTSAVPWRRRLARLALLGALALALITPALLLTWQARQAMFPSGGTFRLSDVEQHGISPDYYLGPNPMHPLARGWVGRFFPVRNEADIVGLGYAAVALAVVGLLTTPWRQTRPFVVMGLIAFVLSLGATLRWRGERVLVDAPEWLIRAVGPLTRDLILPEGQLPILLPNIVLYYTLPFYDSVRVWARYAAPLTLVVALLAGFGAAWLLAKGRAGKLLAVALGALVVFEGLTAPYPVFNDVAVNDRAVNDWLAAQPAGTAIIEYPRPWVEVTALYSQALHGQSVANGYMSFMPDHLAAVDHQLGEWPNREALPVLREWGIDYVIVSRQADDEHFRQTIWPAIIDIGALCPVGSFPDAFRYRGFTDTYVFALRPVPGAPCPTPAVPIP